MIKEKEKEKNRKEGNQLKKIELSVCDKFCAHFEFNKTN